jgi:hypothetical protein
LLALVTVWSPAMAMGFANFSLSLALTLFAFVLWIRLSDWPWRAALFVPIGMAVWLCHSAGWGVLGVMVFGYEWHRRHSWRAFLAPWPLFVPFLLVLAEQRVGGTFLYGTHPLKFKTDMWIKALDGTTPLLDLFSVVVLALAVLIAFCSRAIDGRMGWGALLVAALTIAVPRHLGGGDFADLRLVPVALMLGCLAIDARVPRWLLWVVPLLFVVRLGMFAEEWHGQSKRLEAALPALEKVPQGARIAFAYPYNPLTWSSSRLSHAGSYATIYRNAVVNSHFAIRGVHMLRLKGKYADFIDPSQRIVAMPGVPIDLSRFAPAARADYLWYIGANPLGKLPPGARVIYRARGSVLAQLAKPAAPR